MSNDGAKAYNATPAETLEQHIMDCNIPKSEAEHWASRTITELRARVEALEGALGPLLDQFDKYLQSDLNHECAHNLLVRYELWEIARATLKGTPHEQG